MKRTKDTRAADVLLGALLGLFVFVLSLLTGCVSGGVRGSTERCDALTTRYELVGAIAIGAAALAGSGAITTAAPSEEGPRVALGISSASLTALSAAMFFVRDDALSAWSDECSTSTVTE